MLVTQLKTSHESLTFHMVTDESVLTRNTLRVYLSLEKTRPAIIDLYAKLS